MKYTLAMEEHLESLSTMSNMAGMAISVKEASSPMNMSSTTTNTKNTANPGMGSSMIMTSSNTIKNMSQYQTAQALADTTKEVFNKNLKPLAPSTLKAANTELENDLNQLKTAIDNKTPFTDIIKIVRIQLHPTLITAYSLQLKSFQ
jgi:hypothetical protein